MATLLAVALSSAAAWLVRPAYAFLIPLVPILGALLARSLRRLCHARGWCREFLLLALATALPFLAWSALRATVVGRFGIVSFGGYNLVGIAGQFLDEEVAAALPPDLQPLARAAIAERTQVAFGGPDLPDSQRLNYDRMEWRYDDTIWKVFTPAAQAHFGDDHAKLNSQLKRLALEIIRLRPVEYAVWIAKATRQGMRKLVSDFVLNPAYLAALLLLVAAQIAVTVRGPTNACETLPNPAAILFLAATLYAAASLALVIVVCPPFGRMTDAAAVLLSGPLLAGLCDRMGQLRCGQVEGEARRIE
jgi:hypothetical protein